jgi:hypothetical protein
LAISQHAKIEPASKPRKSLSTAISAAMIPQNHPLDSLKTLNQITRSPTCDGALIVYALNLLSKVGAVTLDRFPYDENDCRRMPDQTTLAAAREYIIEGWRRINQADLSEVKTHLSAGFPVLAAISVDDEFDVLPRGAIYHWHGRRVLGYHAIIIIGYSDNMSAVRMLNSWGTRWADGGYGWVDYDSLRHIAIEAYVSNDRGSFQQVVNSAALLGQYGVAGGGCSPRTGLARIETTRDGRVTAINECNNYAPLLQLDATTLFAQDWKALRADVYAPYGLISWSNNSAWLRSDSKLLGNFVVQQGQYCKPKTREPVLVVEPAGLLQAINECRDRATVQSFPDPDTLHVWNLTAKFTDQHSTLTFSNGTVWQRQ